MLRDAARKRLSTACAAPCSICSSVISASSIVCVDGVASKVGGKVDEEEDWRVGGSEDGYVAGVEDEPMVGGRSTDVIEDTAAVVCPPSGCWPGAVFADALSSSFSLSLSLSSPLFRFLSILAGICIEALLFAAAAINAGLPPIRAEGVVERLELIERAGDVEGGLLVRVAVGVCVAEGGGIARVGTLGDDDGPDTPDSF